MSRTLFIQLERLGDLIQTTSLLREYRAARPGKEIHLLALDENQSALAGLGAVDRSYVARAQQLLTTLLVSRLAALKPGLDRNTTNLTREQTAN